MENHFKEILIKDIQSHLNAPVQSLDQYFYAYKQEAHWLYCPFILRNENQSVVYAWKYLLSESHKIVGHTVYDRGENKSDFWQQLPMVQHPLESDYKKKVIDVFKNNRQIFIPEQFAVDLEAILKKFSVEVVIQEIGFRLMVRRQWSEVSLFDVFVKNDQQKLVINTFDPPK